MDSPKLPVSSESLPLTWKLCALISEISAMTSEPWTAMSKDRVGWSLTDADDEDEEPSRDVTLHVVLFLDEDGDYAVGLGCGSDKDTHPQLNAVAGWAARRGIHIHADDIR